MFSSTDAYGRHVGRYGRSLSLAHVAAAGVRPSDHVLDVGCGPGALTSVLAEIAGADHVAAVDPSASFVEECRRRVPGADVRLGTGEELPDFGRSFDVVLSQLVVNFMADAEAGVRAMRAAAREGATVASCVWDYGGRMLMLRAFWDAALEVDPEAPDERAMPHCSPEALADLWQRCGLTDVETGELVAHADYEDFDDFWAPFPMGLGPSGAYCVSLDDGRREALREACYRRLGAPGGSFALSARAWFVRGRA